MSKSMLDRIDYCLAGAVVGLNFFMMGIEESSLYTILPKYFSHHSINSTSNNTRGAQSNSSSVCYTDIPPYVIVSMIFLSKNIAQLLANVIIGIAIGKINNYFILIAAQLLGIVISIIYGFSNTLYLYIIGRIIDSFVSCGIFITLLSIISEVFTNVNIRGRYFGFANILFFASHSLGPVYGAEIDSNLGKSAVFFVLIPFWIICIILSVLFYWKIKRNTKRDKTFLTKDPLEIILDTSKEVDETKIDEVTVLFPNTTENNQNNNVEIKDQKKIKDKSQYSSVFSPTFHILKDPFVLACLLQLFIVNLSMFSLPPTLPAWMGFRLCATEVQQGLVWTFGFMGYIVGVNIIVFIVKYLPRLRLYAPVFAQIINGILLILLPFSRDWRFIFVPIVGMYLSIGVVEQVIFPMTTFLADTRFQSNYGTISSLTSQSLTISGIIGTLCSGSVAERFGFHTLAIGIGVINILFSPISMLHLKIVSK